eukprot:m.170672 g.170672  ORF g.170672 m.170672 type:complete len:645 (-) comp13274_c0_seq1:1563-3497(-)
MTYAWVTTVAATALLVHTTAAVGMPGSPLFHQAPPQHTAFEPVSLSLVQSAVATYVASQSWETSHLRQARLQDEICAPPLNLPLQLSVDSGCNVTIFVCTIDNGHTWIANATAIENKTVDKAVGMGPSNTNQTLAVFESLYRLLNIMDATFDHVDCACATTDMPEGYTCTLRVTYCAYLRPIDETGNVTLLYRSRVWDVSNPTFEGVSPGYADPSMGTTQPFTAQLQAAQNLRAAHPDRSCGDLTPLIIFPGFQSSLVEYRMTDSPPPPGHPFCPRSTPNNSWIPIFPPTDFLQPACFASTIASHFDPTTSTFGPERQGLETRTLDFGGFQGMPGFAPVSQLLEIAGWEVGTTLFGVPFDWRLPAPALEDTFTQMRALIENVTAMNNGRKVAIWAFSGGPQPTLGFLHRQTQAWKDKYVNWFVASSPVWGGVVTSPAAYISGATGPVPQPVNFSSKLGYELIQTTARALPAALWYFPRAGTNSSNSWTADEPIVTTKTKKYTAFDAVELLTDLGADANTLEALKFLASEPDLSTFADPGVNTMVTFGTGFPTLLSLTYDKDMSKSDLIFPTGVTTETGDTLVTRRSSLRSLAWSLPLKAQGKQFVQNEYAGQSHAQCFPMSILGTPSKRNECFRDVLNLINKPQ